MANVVPNPERTALYFGDLDDGPLTPRQRTIADAVRGCDALADFGAAPEQTVTSITVAIIRLGTTPEQAERQIREGIAKARKELDRMENILNAYGAQPYMPARSGVPARGLKANTRHGILLNLFRYLNATGQRLVRAGDKDVTIAPDGSYVVDE